MLTFDEQLNRLVSAALKEDVGNGDHSTLCCIPAGVNGKARLKIKEEGIIAGIEVAKKIFGQVQPSSVFISPVKQDGDAVQYGDIAFEVESTIHTILKCERLVLNCMQRMSGIATLTKKYTDKLRGFKTKILDTRKTTPNFRLLEKEAVRIGHGMNHRMGLYDMIMIKDNHIDYCGGLEKAVQLAHDYVQLYIPGVQIEVETRTLEDVRKAVAIGREKIARIMLDNFKPAEIVKALDIIQGQIETEASGGIDLNNMIEYAETGVDYISVGALIHQAQSLDLSLKAII